MNKINEKTSFKMGLKCLILVNIGKDFIVVQHVSICKRTEIELHVSSL